MDIFWNLMASNDILYGVAIWVIYPTYQPSTSLLNRTVLKSKMPASMFIA